MPIVATMQYIFFTWKQMKITDNSMYSVFTSIWDTYITLGKTLYQYYTSYFMEKT